jgi:hypothetical protein
LIASEQETLIGHLSDLKISSDTTKLHSSSSSEASRMESLDENSAAAALMIYCQPLSCFFSPMAAADAVIFIALDCLCRNKIIVTSQ